MGAVEFDGCGKCIRYSMFLANFIIWLGSIALLVLGIWTLVDGPFLGELLGTNLYMTSAYILIATGCIIFFVSFLGCLGALKGIKCMLLTYFILVLLLFIILLVGGILGYVFRDKAETSLQHTMNSTMKEYEPGKDEPTTKAWDDTQDALKCCGIDDPEDWAKFNNKFSTDNNQNRVPQSCCRKDDDGQLMDCQKLPTKDNSYTDGCLKKASGFLKDHAITLGGAGIAVAFIMILGLIFSMVLFKTIE
ncbi:tetraspanin 74F [Oratosquilla oratoria]|uniref:tetraspanin 74F n=1 Tax=Oratosquilla oratoria TaxID=337810 RepID=UPI003F772CAC